MPSILPLWTYTDFFLTPLHPNSQHLLSPFQGKPLVYWNSHAPRVYRKTQFILLGHYMHVWGIWYCFAIWLSNSMQVASSLTFFFFFALSMIYFYDSLLTGCVPECQQFFFAEWIFAQMLGDLWQNDYWPPGWCCPWAKCFPLSPWITVSLSHCCFGGCCPQHHQHFWFPSCSDQLPGVSWLWPPRLACAQQPCVLRAGAAHPYSKGPQTPSLSTRGAHGLGPPVLPSPSISLAHTHALLSN